ncbi:hypothetical protein SISSUDRAFT_1038167 [Sistotremastrum suecicum HHB10207 ss-3]|uniref:RNase III domain-containing protein n=1 Tax=Sistotremastrum suecicum HHB10207 ss-3 TaxID=1314776 RepID=A0A165X503_9AGAM|nr:hypothetical protein SISSUDRAFT_1038167 [Sistotremastrum suecicum HHB10207 ss-3]
MPRASKEKQHLERQCAPTSQPTNRAKRPYPQGHIQSLKTTRDNIYRLQVGSSSQFSDAMNTMNPKLRKIAGNCHPTERAKPDAPIPPVPIIPDKRPMNKLLETLGDLVLKIYVARILERFARTKIELQDMSHRQQQNFILSHLVNETSLMDHPDVTTPWEDSVAHRKWDPSSGEEPPKYLANFAEGVVGGHFFEGGMVAVARLLDPIALALHMSVVNKQLRGSIGARDQASIWELPDVEPKHASVLTSLVRFIRTEKAHIRSLGYELLAALPEKGARMQFDEQGTLISFHSHVMEVGEGLTLSVIFTGWLRTRLDLFLQKLPAKLPKHLMELEHLVSSPVVLAHLAYALGVHHHIHRRHRRLTARGMANAFIAAVGFFESNNQHQLFTLERLFELLVNFAHDRLGGPCHILRPGFGLGVKQTAGLEVRLALVSCHNYPSQIFRWPYQSFCVMSTNVPHVKNTATNVKRLVTNSSSRKIQSGPNTSQAPRLVDRETLHDMVNIEHGRHRSTRQLPAIPRFSPDIAVRRENRPGNSSDNSLLRNPSHSHTHSLNTRGSNVPPVASRSNYLAQHPGSFNILDEDDLLSDTESNSSTSSWRSDYLVDDGEPLSENTSFNLSGPRKSRSKLRKQRENECRPPYPNEFPSDRFEERIYASVETLASNRRRELDNPQEMASLGRRNFLGSQYTRPTTFKSEPAGFFYDLKPDAIRELGILDISFPGSDKMRERQEVEWFQQERRREEVATMKRAAELKTTQARYNRWQQQQQESAGSHTGKGENKDTKPVIDYDSSLQQQGLSGGLAGKRVEERHLEQTREKQNK